MSEHIFIHFQEGFAGDVVELWNGPERLGHWSLTTRLQTGMAKIETLDAESGDELRFIMPDAGLNAKIIVPPADGDHVFLVNHDGQKLRVTATEDEPGYL